MKFIPVAIICVALLSTLSNGDLKQLTQDPDALFSCYYSLVCLSEDPQEIIQGFRREIINNVNDELVEKVFEVIRKEVDGSAFNTDVYFESYNSLVCPLPNEEHKMNFMKIMKGAGLIAGDLCGAQQSQACREVDKATAAALEFVAARGSQGDCVPKPSEVAEAAEGKAAEAFEQGKELGSKVPTGPKGMGFGK